MNFEQFPQQKPVDDASKHKVQQPQFIKDFSKERSAEERKELAQEIREKRGKYFAEKAEKKEILSQTQKERAEKERETQEMVAGLTQLEKNIEHISRSLPKKIFNYFHLKKLRADLERGQRTYEELERERGEIEQKETAVEKQTTLQPELEEAKNLLSEFYKNQKEQWAKSEYTKEDIEKNFSEEHLAKLSLEDYATLLKRFPSEMVTHVVRQGIRDHSGMIEHSAGLEEYHDGFMKIAADQRLRSPLGVYLAEDDKEKGIANFFKERVEMASGKLKTKEEALQYIYERFEGGSMWSEGGAKYADRMAIHFATEGVADEFYGAEKGNEIFFAYPSAHIASQYYFNGQLTEGDPNQPTKYNDQWVWANEERGMSINAGLTFIPENAHVDPETGSQYVLDEKKNPKLLLGQGGIDTLRHRIELPTFRELAEEARNITDVDERVKKYGERLAKEHGITDPKLQKVVLSAEIIYQVKNYFTEEYSRNMHGQKLGLENIVREALRANDLLYQRPEHPISSKDFWENYFKEHPEQKPNKIVYYNGEDPTAALMNWKKGNGLIKKGAPEDLGFSEKRVSKTSEQALTGMDRFPALARKAVIDHF